VLRELALARFPEDAEVAHTMRRAEELAVQQAGDPAAFCNTPTTPWAGLLRLAAL
jgi:hypothetical protein